MIDLCRLNLQGQGQSGCDELCRRVQGGRELLGLGQASSCVEACASAAPEGGGWRWSCCVAAACCCYCSQLKQPSSSLSLFLLISQNSKMIGLKKSWSSTRAHHLCLRDHHQKITGFKDFEFRRWALWNCNWNHIQSCGKLILLIKPCQLTNG